MMTWTTDEYGNKTGSLLGWTITFWSSDPTKPYVMGPNGEDIDIIDGVLHIEHEASYEGSVTVRVPLSVMLEVVKVFEENRA